MSGGRSIRSSASRQIGNDAESGTSGEGPRRSAQPAYAASAFQSGAAGSAHAAANPSAPHRKALSLARHSDGDRSASGIKRAGEIVRKTAEIQFGPAPGNHPGLRDNQTTRRKLGTRQDRANIAAGPIREDARNRTNRQHPNSNSQPRQKAEQPKPPGFKCLFEVHDAVCLVLKIKAIYRTNYELQSRTFSEHIREHSLWPAQQGKVPSGRRSQSERRERCSVKTDFSVPRFSNADAGGALVPVIQSGVIRILFDQNALILRRRRVHPACSPARGAVSSSRQGGCAGGQPCPSLRTPERRRALGGATDPIGRWQPPTR